MVTNVAYILGIVFTMISGVCLALQTGVNATLARHAGSKGFAAMSSFLTGCIVCTVFMFIESGATKQQLPSPANIATAPWWSWLGGPLGCTYVITVIIFAQQLGAATLVAIFVTMLLITTVGLDLLGAIGFVQRSISWQRMLGAAFLVVGTLLVTLYPGEVKHPAAAAAVTAAVAATPTPTGGLGGGSGTGRSLSGVRLLSWKSWASLEGLKPATQQQQRQQSGYSSGSTTSLSSSGTGGSNSGASKSGCTPGVAATAAGQPPASAGSSFSIGITT